MTYFLLVFLFDVNGEFIAKDVTEAASLVQCEDMAAAYAKTIINTQNSAKFFCVSEKHYLGIEKDTGVDYDG